ncbi:MAG TPA: plastocyanin/azurin family copper-binding protein [Solirubrobacteraceae bacterium]|jgi:plastocyanin|nr:plastocyanin/azurin family copper-binding protein [Solirubrobacteraceae bacterium]
MTPEALVQAVSILADAAFHDKSKVAFYIFGGGLAAWAVIVGVTGFTRADFPGSGMRARAVMVISFVLMVCAMGAAVGTASTPPPAKPYTKYVGPPKGTAPAPTPLASSAAPATTTPAAALPPGTVDLAANANGQLMFDSTSLSVKANAGKVTIVFTNASPVPHNVAVAQGSRTLGSTPTFTGGSKTLVLALKPGTYTYYCSVPGHRQAGMQGTLTVS